MARHQPLRTGATEPEARDSDLRTRVAWLYYMEGLTQDAIAEKLEISRIRVLKMLASCRQDGTVQIRVTSKLAACVALERQLETRFAIRQAIVIPSPENDDRLPALLGAAVGAYLNDTLRNGMRVGLGWGSTLRHSLTNIASRSLAELTVVSLLGALTRAAGVNPSEFAWRFADMFGADCYMMAAPVYAPDEATHAALLAHPGIEEVFTLARRIDVALVSVGDLSPVSTIARLELIPPHELEQLRRAGAVADVLCRFIDQSGRIIDHPLNRRVVAVDPRQLRQAPRLVLASGGWNKVQAMLAAMRLLSPSVIITDEHAAGGLLASLPMEGSKAL
ncbi:sugar-binding transcriptional regulator [Lichenicoccus sp.]|uniref:sugar-binding transcriptional regulator n=1 Tax=Lichenicoccus sp. TaxID=2781899 RepID=UPI003D0F349F